MATEGQGRASQAPTLTSLPRLEDLPPRAAATTATGFARRSRPSAATPHSCRCSCACSRPPGRGGVEPTGHAVRMDALHLIRAAAEMADTIERDAQSASAAQLRAPRKRSAAAARAPGEQADVDRTAPRASASAQRCERRQDRGAGDCVQDGRARSVRRDQEAESRGAPAARAGPPPGDRAHERCARRGRADARVGARPGRRRSSPAPRKAPRSCSRAAGLGDDVVGRVAETIVDAAKAAAEGSRGTLIRRSGSRRAAPPLSPPGLAWPTAAVSPPGRRPSRRRGRRQRREQARAGASAPARSLGSRSKRFSSFSSR